MYTIGELARRTGLSVRTIRFYADTGVVPPTDRTSAGYRLYDLDALTRLDLVRTLRDLGLDLATIQRVLASEVSVPEVAARHAEALDTQIRTLRLRRAVLRAVAKRGSSPQELELMHRLAQLSEAGRNRIIHTFIDDTFGDLDANPDFVAMMRSATPDLPDDPTPEQVDAWVELAELVADPDFRSAIRRMAEYQATQRAVDPEAGAGLHGDLVALVREKVTTAVSKGIDPDSPEAQPIVTELTAGYATAFGTTDPAWIIERLETANDPRAERYWQLLATINGWPVPPTLTPVFTWFTQALRASLT